MPALLPKCCAMYEVGCYYIDGDNIDKLLVDSPDGLIRCNHNINRADCCQADVYGLNSGNESIEIKSPYPDGNNMPVHYSIPRYYILHDSYKHHGKLVCIRWSHKCGFHMLYYGSTVVACSVDEN